MSHSCQMYDAQVGSLFVFVCHTLQFKCYLNVKCLYLVLICLCWTISMALQCHGTISYAWSVFVMNGVEFILLFLIVTSFSCYDAVGIVFFCCLVSISWLGLSMFVDVSAVATFCECTCDASPPLAIWSAMLRGCLERLSAVHAQSLRCAYGFLLKWFCCCWMQ